MDLMTKLNIYFTLPLGAYLIGAIPFGYLIGRLRGVDVRTQGSGNIGSTNIGRVLGKSWGYFCFVLDVLKGALPVIGAAWYLRSSYPMDDSSLLPPSAQIMWLVIGGGCILGHVFPVYLKFRGGKGVATSLGVMLGIWPYFTLTAVLALLVWLAIWGMWRYVSLASITAAVSFPIGFSVLCWRIPGWNLMELLPLMIFGCLMALLVIVRHLGNIQRLLNGTEKKGKPRQDTNKNPSQTHS